MTRTKLLGLLAFSCIVISSCKDFLNKDDKYQRPDWLAGKVYTQVKAEEDLSTFAKCIELSGYDTIIDVSGSYTVFAPNNEAFTLFFQEHPQYNSIEDIPVEELSRIVKFHIVQNPWTKNQLMSLDVWGWIDSTDINNNEPRGFKRETLLLEKDKKYGVEYTPSRGIKIIDTSATSWRRRVITDSRKFAPIFFKEYFDIYKLQSSDYAFYFDRPIEGSSDLYFAGAKILGPEIFAENGFVYHVDRVVDPLDNGYEILSSDKGSESYKRYLGLINKFPKFEYNEAKTLDQPGADLGLAVDSLFDLTFPDLTFNLAAEETSAPPGSHGLPDNVTIRYHHGVVAPTDQAYADFEDEYMKITNGWGSVEQAPSNIQRIVARSQLSVNPVYPTDFVNGFYNGEMDYVTLDPNTIVEKKFGSNCTFMGVNQMIVPRAFKAVTGPIYLQRGYNKVMLAIEYSGLLSALKKPGADYQLYIESDLNTRLDSSLLYERKNGQDRFYLYSRGEEPKRSDLSLSDIRNLLMNHIGLAAPNGIARKEFMRTLSGNYLIVDNQTGVVSGPTPSTEGYQGPVRDPMVPVQISTNADNGTTWEIPDWFLFRPSTMFLKIRDEYPAFYNLINKAGLAQPNNYSFTFTSDNEIYTVFIPTADALAAYQADTLNTEDLRKFLMMHFIRGNMIFTDGNKSDGYYETLRVDEKSTSYSTVFTKIHLTPGYDVINIVAGDGSTYATVNESDLTNKLTGRIEGSGSSVYPRVVFNGVLHSIDTVLVHSQLDVR